MSVTWIRDHLDVSFISGSVIILMFDIGFMIIPMFVILNDLSSVSDAKSLLSAQSNASMMFYFAQWIHLVRTPTICISDTSDGEQKRGTFLK